MRGSAPVPLADDVTLAGFLAVRLRGRWQRLWCAVRQGALRMFPEPGSTQRPVCSLRLEGCQVSPGAAAGSPQHLRIRIAQRGRELALLQVSNPLPWHPHDPRLPRHGGTPWAQTLCPMPDPLR